MTDVDGSRSNGYLTRRWTGARYANLKWIAHAEIVYSNVPGQFGR